MKTEQFNGGTDELWSAEDMGDEIYIWGEDDMMVGLPRYVVSPHPSREEVDYQAMEVDGRLMAAAPLLLAKLKRLRADIRSILSDYDITELIRDVPEEEWNFEQQALVQLKELIE